MEKRFIGIDFDGSCVRVAIMEQDREAAFVLGKHAYGTPEEMVSGLREIIGDPRIFGDRVALAVPAVEVFVRHLTFPFTDPRKIESALPFELSAQLPIPIEELSVDFQAPRPEKEGGCRTCAAALRTEYLEKLLQAFDGADFPVHIVDVAPFAYARGVRDQLPDGLLVSLGEQETTLALMKSGRLSEYRLIPGGGDEDEMARFLLREGIALQRDAGAKNLPMSLIGPGATPTLAEKLRQSGRQITPLRFYGGGRDIEPEFLPAVALALRAAAPPKEREFNFRRGKYALKSEWAGLKKEIIAASVVLFLTIATLAGTATLNYVHKSNRLQALEQEMVTVFRETFPGTQPMVDIPLQMRSRINQLREQARQLGSGPQGSAISVLNEISQRMPGDVTVDVRDLAVSADQVRMEGVTTSFDAINQIARSLQESPFFADAQIADAKASIDGNRVDFRLTLTFQRRG
jgi:general secretion pathway protein L